MIFQTNPAMSSQEKTGTAGVEGTDFQLNLILMCLLRAQRLYGENFKLTTELASAGKFDDLVLNYTDAAGEHIRLLQAKHKTQEKNTVTYADLLLQPKSSFDLFQYFKSYREVILQPDFRGKIEDIILFTNLNFNKDVLEFVEQIDRPTDIFYFHTIKCTNSTPILCKFNDKFLDEFQYCKLKNLSKQIIQYGFKRIPMKENNNTFKDFHGVLAKEVIDIKRCLFWEHFLECNEILKTTTKIFRRIIEEDFLKEFRMVSEGKEAVFLEVNGLDKTLFEMKFSPNFGSKLSDDWPKGTVMDPGDAESLKSFLDQLVMAVNQPNEKELVGCIQKEVESNFKFDKSASEIVTNQLMKNVKDWFKQEKTSYLGKTDVDEFKNYIMGRINELTKNKLIIALSHDFTEKLDYHQIQFVGNSLQPILMEFLESDTKRIMHLRSGAECRINAIKLLRALECVNRQDFLFIEMKKNLRKKILKLLDLFESSDNFHLLAIECEDCDEYEFIHDELKDIFESRKNKKFVMIGNAIPQLDEFKDEVLEVRDEIAFTDLTEDSQRNILDKQVLFQGFPVQLNQLGQHMDMRYWRWMELMSDHPIRIGSEIESTKGYDERYYINRVLVRRIPCFDKNLQARLGPQHILTFTRTDFDEKCAQHPLLNIHLMKRIEDNGLMWQKTRGRISALRPNIKKERMYSIRDDHEDLLGFMEDKIIIISDTAGMGKSTLFTRLSKAFKASDPLKWIIRVNLISSNIELREFQAEMKTEAKPSSSKMIEYFATKILKITCPMEMSLCQQFMTDDGTGTHQVIFLFDGFDEMIVECHDILLDIMTYLAANGNVKLIGISTRPHLQSILEENLQQFSLIMEPFTHQNKMDFLRSYWLSCHRDKTSDNLSSDKTVIGGKLETYAERLLATISKSINDSDSELTGIPLQLRMIAEVFEDEALAFADNNEEGLTVGFAAFGVLELYNKFFEKKEQIYIKEKANSGDSNFITNTLLKRNLKIIRDTQKNLAITNLFPNFATQGMEQMADVLNDLLIFGLVQENHGRYFFIHQTFAEYLVAVYMMENFVGSDTAKEILFKFILTEDQFPVVRTFIDQIIRCTGYEDILNWMKTNPAAEQLVNVNRIFLKALDEETLYTLDMNLNYCHSKDPQMMVQLMGDIMKFSQIRWKCEAHGSLLDWSCKNLMNCTDVPSNILSCLTANVLMNACHKSELFGVTSDKPKRVAQQLLKYLEFLKDAKILSTEMLEQSIMIQFKPIQINPYFRFDALEVYLDYLYANHLDLLRKLILRIGQVLMHAGEKRFTTPWLKWLQARTEIPSDIILETIIGNGDSFRVRRLYWDVKYENNEFIGIQLSIMCEHLIREYNEAKPFKLECEHMTRVVSALRELFDCSAWTSTDKILSDWITDNCEAGSLEKVLVLPDGHQLTPAEYYSLWSRFGIVQNLLGELSQTATIGERAVELLIQLKQRLPEDDFLQLIQCRNTLQESVLQKACKEKIVPIVDLICSWLTTIGSAEVFDEVASVRVQSTIVRFDMQLLDVVVQKFPHYVKRFLLQNKETYIFDNYSSDHNFHFDVLNQQVLQAISSLPEPRDIIELLNAKGATCKRTITHNYVEHRNPEMLFQLLSMIRERQLDKNDICDLFALKDVHGRTIGVSADILKNKEILDVLDEFIANYFDAEQKEKLREIKNEFFK